MKRGREGWRERRGSGRAGACRERPSSIWRERA